MASNNWVASLPYLTRGQRAQAPRLRATPLPMPQAQPGGQARGGRPLPLPLPNLTAPGGAAGAGAGAGQAAPGVQVQVGTPLGASTTSATTPAYVPSTGEFSPDLPFEQYPGAQYGFPMIEEQMRYLGFQPVTLPDGRVTWQPINPGQQYDVAGVNQQIAHTRDIMEPELLRMIGGGEAALAQRGMGRSSLMAGMQGGLRGQYATGLQTSIFDTIQKAKQDRWQRLMQMLSGVNTTGQALSAGDAIPVREQDDGGAGWASILGMITGLPSGLTPWND